MTDGIEVERVRVEPRFILWVFMGRFLDMGQAQGSKYVHQCICF